MRILKVEQLQKIKQMIDSYTYKPDERLTTILRQRVTADNVYIYFDILNSLYPTQYSNKEYHKHLLHIFNQIKFEVNIDKIDIQFLKPCLNNLNKYITTPAGLYCYGCLLYKYDLLNTQKLKQIMGQLKYTAYTTRWCEIGMQYLLSDEEAVKTMKILVKYAYSIPNKKRRQQTELKMQPLF